MSKVYPFLPNSTTGEEVHFRKICDSTRPQSDTADKSDISGALPSTTVCGHRMAHRKWKETKQQHILLFSPMSFIGIRFCAFLLFQGDLAECGYFTNQTFYKPLSTKSAIWQQNSPPVKLIWLKRSMQQPGTACMAVA